MDPAASREFKTIRLPGVRIEPSRQEAYTAAYEARRGARLDFDFTDWMREALDEKAERDGHPVR